MTSFPAALLLSSVTVFALIGSGRLSAEEFPSASRKAFAMAILVLTLAIACFLPLLEFPETDPNRELGDLPFGALFVGHALLVSFLFVWWLLVGRPRIGAFLHLGTGTKELQDGLRLGAAAGVAAWAVTMTTMAIVGTVAANVEPGSVPEGGEVPATVGVIVGLAWYERLALVLSAGVVEEAFFRSFLQTRCGLMLSSVLFATSHMSYGLPLMVVGVFAVSVVFGLVFRARRDVFPCMVAHAVFDAIQLFLILPAVVAGS